MVTLSARLSASNQVSAVAEVCATQTAHHRDEISVFILAGHKFLKTVVVNISDLQAHKVNRFCFPPRHHGQD